MKVMIVKEVMTGDVSPVAMFFNLCATAVQDFVVAGGLDDGLNELSSVLTLLPRATAWTELANLPRALKLARASIVGGRLRVNGGWDHGDRSEVMIEQ